MCPEDSASRAERSGPDGHVLLTQRGWGEVLARTAAWVQCGLEQDEWVLIVEPHQDPRAPGLRGAVAGWAGHVREGRLAVLPAGEVFSAGAGSAGPGGLVEPSLIERAVADGYRGARMVVQGAPPGVDCDEWQWLGYERHLEDLTRTHPLSVLCQYHHLRGELLLAGAELHSGGVVESTVQLTPRRGWTRLAGEVDLSNARLVESALRAAAEAAGEVLVLDVTELRFLCVAGRPVRRVLELLQVDTSPGFDLPDDGSASGPA